MGLRIYNTLSRKEEDFTPLEDGKVKMYVCGPTVYADSHVGHAMAAVVFDMVRRYLIYRGYQVHYVTNFTDVDDKIIARANQTGEDPFELANRYATDYLRHLDDLNVLPADEYPRVSNEIPEIIHFIEELGEKGYAYELDGDVYFSVQKDDDYGKLSRRKLEEAQTGTRVEEDARKQNSGRLRPLEIRQTRRALLGQPVGTRPPRLAYRVLQHVLCAPWARPWTSTAAATT